YRNRTTLFQIFQKRNRALDLERILTLHRTRERHIPIHAHDDGHALQLGGLGQRAQVEFHFKFLPTSSAISARRCEYPHSLSYQAMTLTMSPSTTFVSGRST